MWWPLVAVNILGILVNVYTIIRTNSRKFFCVIDKIPLGKSAPAAWIGLIAHLASNALAVLELGGYGFYPL
jgi:hypothetical protein